MSRIRNIFSHAGLPPARIVSPRFTSLAFVACALIGGCFLAMPAGAAAADSVIYYNRIETFTNAATLRRVNPDGTGDQSVTMALPGPLFPTASRDGRILLVTSPDPGRPFKISNNAKISAAKF